MNAARRRAQQIGLWVLFASAFLAPAVANVGLLLAVAFPFAVTDWRGLLRQPVVLALLACGGYLIVLTVVLSLAPPEGTSLHWDGLWVWFRLALFIPVAFFVRAAPADLSCLLLLCVLGFIIGALWKLDWEHLTVPASGLLQHQPGPLRLHGHRLCPFQRHRTAGRGPAAPALVGWLARAGPVVGGLSAPAVAGISDYLGARGLAQSRGDSGVRIHALAPLSR